MSSCVAYPPPTYWTPEDEDNAAPAWVPTVVVEGKPDKRPADQPPPQWEPDIKTQFDVLAEELAADGAGVSNTRSLLSHPAYLGILALGERAIPLLLNRLESPGARPIWLTLLGSLTTFQPGAGTETIEEAAAHWVSWGKLHGHSV